MIDQILIVTGGKHPGDFLRLLGSGKAFGTIHLGLHLSGEAAIADALALAESFADGDRICVILGDDIISGSLRPAIEGFRSHPCGAKILMNAQRFGVAEIRDGMIGGIEEKPKCPKSNYPVTGIPMYDHSVFEEVRRLVPSRRGELEVTDVNNRVSTTRQKLLTPRLRLGPCSRPE